MPVDFSPLLTITKVRKFLFSLANWYCVVYYNLWKFLYFSPQCLVLSFVQCVFTTYKNPDTTCSLTALFCFMTAHLAPIKWIMTLKLQNSISSTMCFQYHLTINLLYVNVQLCKYVHSQNYTDHARSQLTMPPLSTVVGNSTFVSRSRDKLTVLSWNYHVATRRTAELSLDTTMTTLHQHSCQGGGKCIPL